MRYRYEVIYTHMRYTYVVIYAYEMQVCSHKSYRYVIIDTHTHEIQVCSHIHVQHIHETSLAGSATLGDTG